MIEPPDITFGGVEMPICQFTGGSFCRLMVDWSIEGLLPDGRVFKVTVRAGFIFDGASIPRAVWRLCGHPLEAPRVAAALAHDLLYALKVCERKTADMVYREICRMVGIGKVCRNVEYAALRACGWVAWNGHTEKDRDFAREHGAFVLEGNELKGNET